MQINKVFLSSVLFFILLVTTSCIGPGLSDWSLKLPNNYEMWRINSKEIVIGYKNTDYSLNYNDNGTITGVKGYVDEFCLNDNFVGAKQIDKTTEKNDSNPRYYLIDTSKKIVYGPYLTEADFNTQCVKLNISDLSKWEKTSPSPKIALYSKYTE